MIASFLNKWLRFPNLAGLTLGGSNFYFETRLPTLMHLLRGRPDLTRAMVGILMETNNILADMRLAERE